MKKPVRILETTLRDGSYALNFQFTAADSAMIASSLEDAGFDMIEIGHGVGLNASNCGYGEAIETDEGYLKSVAGVIKKAGYGMFCIPGIARLEDVDMAADYGSSFIRIGTNVTDVKESEKFIERAKKHGMYVSANFMKSYTSPPKVFAEKALLSGRYGADLICLVDSSGGMLPEEVKQYICRTRDVCDVDIGFHGHDNLGLAMGNCLVAVANGAVTLDSSMQGFGRSAGNTPTETLVMGLLRSGINPGIDYLKLMDASEKFVKPLVRKIGIDSIDVITGYALFHSSYMGLIKKYSLRYSVDPRKLIIEVSKINKVEASDDFVEKVAQKIKKEDDEIYSARFNFPLYHIDEQNG